MALRAASVANTTRALAAALLVIVMTSSVNSHVAGAEQNVQAIVCSQAAQVTIQAPVSDSVTSESTVTLSGTVRQANQLEVYIDGAFNSVVPLDVAATTYTTTVHVAPGTRTIKLVAVDACQIGNGTNSVVITYTPVGKASTGNQTPTAVSGGVVISKPAEPLPVTSDNLLQHYVLNPLRDTSSFLNLSRPDATIAASGAPQPVRFALVTLGAVAMVFAPSLQVGLLGKVVQGFGTQMGLNQRYAGRLVTIVLGGLLMALAFLL